MVEGGSGKSIVFAIPHATRRPPAKDLVAAIGDKDLFDEKRSASLPAAGPAVEEARPLNVSLVGIVTSGGERAALVSEQGQPKPVWLREGEDVGGNLLESIGPDSVVFSTAGGEKVTVELKIQESKGPAAGAAAAAAAAARRAAEQAAQARQAQGTSRAEEIRAKIERLREEARARREARMRAATGR